VKQTTTSQDTQQQHNKRLKHRVSHTNTITGLSMNRTRWQWVVSW